MSFHFRKLQLKDWLVYGQTTIFDFPDFERGKNLVVIYGQNGYGKTSLLKALQFLFHNAHLSLISGVKNGIVPYFCHYDRSRDTNGTSRRYTAAGSSAATNGNP